MQHHWQQFLAKYHVIEMRTKSGQLSPVWRGVTTCSSSLEVRQDHVKEAQSSLINLLSKAKMDLLLHNLILTKQLSDSKVHKVVLMCYTILSVHEYIECSWIFGRAITAISKTLARLQWPVSWKHPPLLLLPSLHIPLFQSPWPKTDGFEHHSGWEVN